MSVALYLVAALAATLWAETYRVGPGEKYAKVSDVAGLLKAGDVVEVTGDIVDHFTLAAHGTAAEPITIRGVSRVVNGAIIRPKITDTPAGETIVWCRGDYTILEGLEFTGALNNKQRVVAICHDCNDLVIRNCAFRCLNWKALVGSPNAGDITIEFSEFDSIGNFAMNGKAVDIWSWKPGAVVTVEHCYFHDATGGVFLKTHAPRNVIRYNWFENCWMPAFNATDRIIRAPLGQEPREGIYPMHTDIVGNVFFTGWSPWVHYSILSIGGHGETEPGPEGDFHIAHNLFIHTTATSETDPAEHILVLGNVDHVRIYNNAFLEYGVPISAAYVRGDTWNTPETRAFVKRRGSGEPIVEGSNNWVSYRTVGIPDAFANTLRGINPKFVDLLNFDFRPRKDSPLVGAGLAPLPKGQIVDLIPEYEPQRGIPADLKPKPRRKVTPPSIGPFEPAE